MINKKDYKKLYPFKGWVLENFPYIEEDFDAITNYQLFSKVVEYLNKITYNQNLVQESNNEVVDFVNNYFANLDVQEEINNKLDDMAEKGQLTEIIAQYLQLAGILAYNTLNDLLNATNIVDGSFAKTYGKLTYNDGEGAFYKIREIVNTDVVDGVNIIAILSDNNLVAELIKDKNIEDLLTNVGNLQADVGNLQTDVGNLQTDVGNLQTDVNRLSNKKYIFIGDSYNEGYGNPDLLGWGLILKDYLGLSSSDYYNLYEGGAGFVRVGNNGHTFQQLLESYENTITNKNDITDIIIAGGCNDTDSNESTINTAIGSMMTYIKTNYPNAKTYIGMIGNNSNWAEAGVYYRNYLAYRVLPAYKDCQKYGATYLENIELTNHDYDLFITDNVHLTDYSNIAKGIYNCLNGNGSQVVHYDRAIDIYDSGLPNFAMSISMHDGLINIRSAVNRITGLSFTLNRYATITNNWNPHYLRARFVDQKIIIPTDIYIKYDNGNNDLFTMAYLILDMVSKEITIFTLERFQNVTEINIGAFDITVDANSF